MHPLRAALRQRCARRALATGAVLTGIGAVSTPLYAQGPDRLEEVVSTGTLVQTPRRQLGTAVSVITAEEIELRGYSDVTDLLRTQPSIGVSNTGGPGKVTTVRIRGEEGYRTVLFIDGVKALDPSAPQVAPNFSSLLTTGDLERIEVLRGPQGFIYGADAGGVVNIMTSRGTGPMRGGLGIEQGAFGTRMLEGSLSGGSERGDYYLSLTDMTTDGFNAQTSDTVFADDDGADNTTAHIKLGWNATDALRVQLVTRTLDASTRYDGCWSSATFSTVHDCYGTTHQITSRLSAEHSGERVTNAFAISSVENDRADFTEGASAFAYQGDIERLEYTGTFRPSDVTTLVYGLDFQEESVVSSERLERYQRGYYLEYQGEFGDGFFLSLGARYDDNEDFGTHTSSRVSAAYVQELAGGGALKYRASYGTGFRAPSLYEISYNNRASGVLPAAAATGLKEENSEGHDIGIEYDTASGLHFEATYFDQKIDNRIGYESFVDPVTFAYLDGYVQIPGTVRSKGIEFAAEAPLGRQWSIMGNWTYNEAEEEEGGARLRRPKNIGNLGLLYRAPSERLRFIANYRVSRDAIDFGNVPLDDYGVFDLSMAYTFNDAVEIHARVQNATDEEYTEVVGFNTAGRAFHAGLRLRFQ